MSRTGERLRRSGALGVALLYLVAWFATGLHLALEPHDHDFAPAVVDHHHDHDDDHHHHDHDDDHEHPSSEGHDADDHLMAASSRPVSAGLELIAVVPQAPCLAWEPRDLDPSPAPPRDEIAPKTDPPPSSRRPRAPPVG